MVEEGCTGVDRGAEQHRSACSALVQGCIDVGAPWCRSALVQECRDATPKVPPHCMLAPCQCGIVAQCHGVMYVHVCSLRIALRMAPIRPVALSTEHANHYCAVV